MKRVIAGCAAIGLLLLSAAVGRGEVKVVSERNARSVATAAFKFKSVPPPSKTDAATAARFSMVAGRADGNGGDIAVLNDGRLPTGEDDPEANFFFAAGSPGGRLLVDLGQRCDVRQINTYSWHAGTRGPQVYRVFASDGSDRNFQACPSEKVDPAKTGWTLIAAVDTRPAQGPLGGQYGVSISDTRGPLGKFRYLLFDVARTESDDPFGNTFFSEIDVDDSKPHAAADDSQGDYTFDFDTSEVPALQPWVDRTLRPVCQRWYPLIVEMLPSDGFNAPRHVTVTFKKDMQGVAYTSGTHVTCAGDWFQRNLNGEAAGAVVHELVHVVQHYGRVRGGSANPGWMVEGIADYVRWFKYEPVSQRPRPNPARAKYTDSYRTTAAFLNYVAETHDKEIVKKFNVAMREGNYRDTLWKTYTGKTVDQLWAEYIKTLQH